jgi:hypothetical protein
MNYIKIGPVALRISTEKLACWGYPLIAVGGLSLWGRMSTSSILLASYHPASCRTWHWSVAISKRNGGRTLVLCQPELRRGQWHHYFNFGKRSIVLSKQDYHRKEVAA